MRPNSAPLLAPLLALGCATGSQTTPESVLTESAEAVEVLRAHNETLDYFIERSTAVLVFPHIRKGGLVFGAAGGNGVLLERASGFDEPTFVALGGVTFGLQAGAETTRVAVVVMNDRLVGILKEGGLDFGVGSRLTLGPHDLEAANSLQTLQDAYVFRDSSGAYAGLTLDGAVVNTSAALTSSYRNVPDTAAAARLKSAILRRSSG